MMCCHGENPIFVNKKNKDWIKTPPLKSDNNLFLPYPHPLPLPQSGRHMCITPFAIPPSTAAFRSRLFI